MNTQQLLMEVEFSSLAILVSASLLYICWLRFLFDGESMVTDYWWLLMMANPAIM